VALGAGRGVAQRGAYRFEIETATDSTITIPTDSAKWVKRGARGIAVDPTDHDAMVARFQVVRVDSGKATAIITGQTTRVTTDHVALIERPGAMVSTYDYVAETNYSWGGIAFPFSGSVR